MKVKKVKILLVFIREYFLFLINTLNLWEIFLFESFYFIIFCDSICVLFSTIYINKIINIAYFFQLYEFFDKTHTFASLNRKIYNKK